MVGRQRVGTGRPCCRSEAGLPGACLVSSAHEKPGAAKAAWPSAQGLLSAHRQRAPQDTAALSESSVSEGKGDPPGLDAARRTCLSDFRAGALYTTMPEIPLSSGTRKELPAAKPAQLA